MCEKTSYQRPPAPWTDEDWMSTRARLYIHEVARELEEDMELGAEGDLNAAAPSTASFPPPLSVARLYSTPAMALCSTALCWVPQATRATV